jgi:PAS domain S-box-containing protein
MPILVIVLLTLNWSSYLFIHKVSYLVLVTGGITLINALMIVLASRRMIEEISERKRFEGEFRASEGKFSSIFHLSPDAIDLTQLETGLSLEINRCYEKMYGYSREELLGHSTLPEDLGLWQKKQDRDRHIADLKANGVSLGLEACMRRKDGSTFIALISSAILDINGQRCNLSVARDITDRKRAEEELRKLNLELRKSEAQKRAMINAIPDIIFTYGRDGEYLAIQAADSSLLILPKEQLLHRKVTEVLPGPIADRFMRTIEAVLATDTVQELNYLLPVASGEYAFEARLAPLTRDTVLAIVRDVTEKLRMEQRQRELQAQLEQTQKMESLGSLAGGVAHDMNNVLAAILAMVSVLDGNPSDAPTRKEALATIARACTRGRNVVKSLLYFARKGLETVGPVHLNSIAGEVVHLLSYTTLSRVQIITSYEEPLGLIEGDEGALSHAMLNLCVNAVDAMPEGGTLEIRSRQREGWGIEVSFKDSGTGMSPEVMNKAMEPFYTTKPVGKGTGLGLAMVYGTVQAHNGTFEIRSEVGRGTEVILGFPYLPGTSGVAAAPREESAPITSGAEGSLNILLVDDDELIRMSVAPMLMALGHHVETAESGQEALDRIQNGLPVDLVILDMNMPGLNGAQTLARLQILRPRQAVLMATGYSDDSMGLLLKEHPNVHSLRKPFSMNEIRTKFESMHCLRKKLGLPE